MGRTFAATFALLLALSSPALVVAGGPGSAVTSSAEPLPSSTDGQNLNVASVDSSTPIVSMLHADDASTSRSAIVTPSADLGSTALLQHTTYRGTMNEYVVDERVAAAETEAERRAVLINQTNVVEAAIDNLSAADNEVRTAYANGEISEEAYLREVARINVEAQHLGNTVNRLNHHAGSVFEISAAPYVKIQRLDSRLLEFQGPVRDRITDVARGQAEPTRVYVASTEHAIVLSMVDDGEYIRESYRADLRTDTSATELPSPPKLASLMEGLYPVASDSGQFQVRSLYQANIVRLTIDYAYASIRSYVQFTTKEVYMETQRYDLSRTPARHETTATADGLTMRVNQTYAGGPVRITLENSRTGEPVDGAISVNDESVGSTGEDGVIWVVDSNEEFTVSAMSGLDSVETSVEPVSERSSER